MRAVAWVWERAMAAGCSAARRSLLLVCVSWMVRCVDGSAGWRTHAYGDCHSQQVEGSGVMVQGAGRRVEGINGVKEEQITLTRPSLQD